MATPFQAHAVKSLNKSAGRRRRFVFKSVSERLNDVEIDVFRSLDKVKDEPSPGSTFFRDCLVEWRELNTAEDFISFHEQMTPLVQTLPLIFLHKEKVFDELVSRLKMSARLSLEPILRLIAALSRDLLEDFIPFLPRIVNALVSLLESGADREPEIVEQIFTSWSCIMRDLQRYLVHRLVYMLEVTEKLRYYPKDYVQEFMAQAMGFLLRTRTAPFEQLDKGIRKIMLDVGEESTPFQKYGVSALLYYAMTGTSTRFHSRANRVLLLMMDNSILDSASVIEVLISALQRLCEDLDSKELNLMFEAFYQGINDCVTNGDILRLSRLLSLLVSTVQVKNGRAISDYKQMLEIVGLLVRTYVIPSCIQMKEEHLSEAVHQILQLMLGILSGLHTYNDLPTISACSLQWAPVFVLQKSSLLEFIRQLLQENICIINIFQVNILRAMNVLIETSKEDIIYLLLTFCEKKQERAQSWKLLDGSSELSRIQGFLRSTVSYWVGVLKGIKNGNLSSTSIPKSDLALLWGIVDCFPHIVDPQEGLSLLFNLTDAIDQLLMLEHGNIGGFRKHTWQSLIGTSLNSYYKLTCGEVLESETSRYLALGKRHKTCPHVLDAVADFLDSVYGSVMEGNARSRIYHPELSADMAMDALRLFADNLCHSNRGIRASTLRILCHYETLSCDEPVLKKMKTELCSTSHVGNRDLNVLRLLLSIESTPLSISTSRNVALLISKIQMGLSAGRISEAYHPLVLNGMIGIFHNRFSHLWNPASECLAVLINQSNMLVWQNFLNYFEQCPFAYTKHLVIKLAKLIMLCPTSQMMWLNILICSLPQHLIVH